jgi:diguanylate cyclase (GGDEF)-like protein
MIHAIYGFSQNYAKSAYEIHAHLTEVTGAFAKYAFKRKDPTKAVQFLPKMFAWSLALLKKVNGDGADIELILLTKYPRSCPYCLDSPCQCWAKTKPTLNDESVRNAYFKNAPKQGRSLNDFQLMFRQIYADSWYGDTGPRASLVTIYTRLAEELSEVAETIRFHHLYPSNFNNELADYLAWWFALVTAFADSYFDGQLVEDVVWPAYPGFCRVCTLVPCDCRPGPVRELLSKPQLTDLSRIDGLTQAKSQGAFKDDIGQFEIGAKLLALPAACIRIDVDDFKKVNDTVSHEAGDEVLKHLVNTIRLRIRPRDHLYRVGGDEFALLCPDMSVKEGVGLMERVAASLRSESVIVRDHRTDTDVAIPLTLSIGVAAALRSEELDLAFSKADDAAIDSKRAGKDRITEAAG